VALKELDRQKGYLADLLHPGRVYFQSIHICPVEGIGQVLEAKKLWHKHFRALAGKYPVCKRIVHRNKFTILLKIPETTCNKPGEGSVYYIGGFAFWSI
jgi:hypothetical protein